jgi:hypothetical protein
VYEIANMNIFVNLVKKTFLKQLTLFFSEANGKSNLSEILLRKALKDKDKFYSIFVCGAFLDNSAAEHGKPKF